MSYRPEPDRTPSVEEYAKLLSGTIRTRKHRGYAHWRNRAECTLKLPRDHVERDSMRISLCMIVRDEAACLDRCLSSVSDVVDEICIVDTGSTDGTQEIAREHGAVLAEVAWKDDFAAARNASLELATGDWILVLDADEELLTSAAREHLLAVAEQHEHAAGHVWLFDEGDAERQIQPSRTQLARFFPRDERIRFHGAIHEQVMFAGGQLPRVETSLEVRHDGYHHDELHHKHKLERNASMIMTALERTPEDPYLWWQLGRTLFVAELPNEALDAFANALDRLAGDDEILVHVVEAAAYCLRSLGRSDDALELVGEISAAHESRSDTCFLRALLSMDVGAFDQAEQGFKHCLELGHLTPAKGLSVPASSGYAAAYNLGVMKEVLEETEDARTYYQRALALNPEHALSRDGLARVCHELPS